MCIEKKIAKQQDIKVKVRFKATGQLALVEWKIRWNH